SAEVVEVGGFDLVVTRFLLALDARRGEKHPKERKRNKLPRRICKALSRAMLEGRSERGFSVRAVHGVRLGYLGSDFHVICPYALLSTSTGPYSAWRGWIIFCPVKDNSNFFAKCHATLASAV